MGIVFPKVRETNRGNNLDNLATWDFFTETSLKYTSFCDKPMSSDEVDEIDGKYTQNSCVVHLSSFYS